jgi:alpha-glucuronidase
MLVRPKEGATPVAQATKEKQAAARTLAAPGQADRAKLRRVVAGVLTGVTERFLSHPIETCKVVLQSTPASASASQVIASRWREQGIASFYRGIFIDPFLSFSTKLAGWLVGS